MRRSPVPVAVIVLAVLLVGLLGYALLGKHAGSNLDSAVKRGERPAAPEATRALPVLGGGGTRTLASMRGKVVFVNVWASWCEPCRSEAPLMAAIQQALAKSGEGSVLGITHDDPVSKSLAFVREFGLTYPSLRDTGSDVYDAFGGKGVPETYVLDAEGRVAAIDRGVLSVAFANDALEAVGAKTRIPAAAGATS